MDSWKRGEAVNNARRNQPEGTKIYLFFDGTGYISICSPSVQEALRFGKKFWPWLEEKGLEEIEPWRER